MNKKTLCVKVSAKELDAVRPELTAKPGTSEFIAKARNIEVGEAIRITINDWKQTHKSLPSCYSIKDKKFERRVSKDNLYWYIIRTA